ncbi:DNA-directed RNA polymerase subunit omega [Desulfurivibrio alkaliphilus]|uniref:DNA-directed RNA polymerase subunit omega n=1 Tax=Desulfurivibrio alkaliphilus (strain DSM 19089 / UNIQEM U267 / AHT2) TaxID=589865 RepID=D6Z4B8_DESAT|nr:DNA-directed RNA polymerase subunit omega [Desulfurivibrio alkaliphilus]ADH86393.1 DNA-directed RNA polymerase, omega subunit [Desulfurivibrio alkaliphilus AHT 2]
MARITVEDCLQQIGNENRFALIHLAVERVKQHRQGAPFPERCKNKEIVCTLREIANGMVNFDNVRGLKKQLQEQAAVTVDQEADTPPAAPAAEA